MKLIYIAGAYRSRSLLGVVRNIFRARQVALRLWRHGYAVICPHLNTAWMSEPPASLPAQLFLDGDLEMVRRCDAILLLQGWEASSGSRGERDMAVASGIQVFYSEAELYARL